MPLGRRLGQAQRVIEPILYILGTLPAAQVAVPSLSPFFFFF